MEQKIIAVRLFGYPFLFLTEEGKVLEIQPVHTPDTLYSVGEIRIGKIKKIVKSIHAVFIEILPGVECYCPEADAVRGVFTCKAGKKPLCVGDELLVQVKKEAYAGKPPAVTAAICLTGKYTVLSTGNQEHGISGKIAGTPRAKIKALLNGLSGCPYGIIVRTEAASLDKEDLLCHIRKETEKLDALLAKARTRTCFSVIKEAEFFLTGMTGHIKKENPWEIITDDRALYRMFASCFREELPEEENRLCFYEDRQLPLAKLYNLEREFVRALAEKVWLKSGGYLIIQPTEALTVIDVNSGKSVSGKKEQSLQINLEAAKEAARQIRLRNLSGIILIDFINLREERDRRLLLETMRAETGRDPVKTDVIDITPLELMEITREKGRRPLSETVKKMGIDHE